MQFTGIVTASMNDITLHGPVLWKHAKAQLHAIAAVCCLCTYMQSYIRVHVEKRRFAAAAATPGRLGGSLGRNGNA
jgi:hypothetical protein